MILKVVEPCGEFEREIFAEIDCDLKYFLDHEASNILVRQIEHDQKRIGFAVISGKKSSFYPAKAILQLKLQSEYIKFGKDVLHLLKDEAEIKLAIGTTENLSVLSIYQEDYKYMMPVAIEFAHGELISELPFPPNAEIRKATSSQKSEMAAIWKEIYEFFKIEYKADIGDPKRTNDQIDNGDAYYLSVDHNIVGLGVANYKYATNGRIEIGYAVRPQYWGKGYGTLMAKYLKKECQARRYVALANCNICNMPSIRVLQKSGMVCRHVKVKYYFN